MRPYRRIVGHPSWQNLSMTDSSPDPLEVFEHWAGGSPRCPAYVGLSRAEAVEVARKAGNAEVRESWISTQASRLAGRWTRDPIGSISWFGTAPWLPLHCSEPGILDPRP
jgi:hypothetical protein